MKIAIFDLDGTIINNQDILLKAFSYSFEEVNEPFPGNDAIRKLFGKDLKTIMTTLDFNMVKFDKFRTVFSQFLSGQGEPKMVRGMKEVLLNLKKEGFRLALVTSKSQDLVQKEIQSLNIHSLFEAIVDESSTSRHKPNPDPLFKACELLGVSPSEDIPYVGDSKYDLIAACNAGLSPIGVTWGVHGKEIGKGLPDRCNITSIIQTPTDLLQFLKNLP